MNLNEAKLLKHGDKVTDYINTWHVGISPSFPHILHFWKGKRKERSINLNVHTSIELKFIKKIEKV